VLRVAGECPRQIAPIGGKVNQTGVNVRVRKPLQLVKDRSQQSDGGQALFGIVAVPLQVSGDQRFEEGFFVSRNNPASDKNLAQAARLVAGPTLECVDQLPALNEVVLKGE
jgi:hypothetical protein